jgi:pimeloyl-ACP methyl ester carboxylesterase
LQSGSQVLETAAGLVEYTNIGSGPVVLISHGEGGGYDMGAWLASLIGGEYRYISPSRFGYLRTPLPENPSPQAQADSYAALLDIHKISSAFILGLSSGGPSALEFALRFPDRCRGLIMLSVISRPIPPLPFVLKMIYPMMLRSDFLPWLIYSISPDFFIPVKWGRSGSIGKDQNRFR